MRMAMLDLYMIYMSFIFSCVKKGSMWPSSEDVIILKTGFYKSMVLYGMIRPTIPRNSSVTEVCRLRILTKMAASSGVMANCATLGGLATDVSCRNRL